MSSKVVAAVAAVVAAESADMFQGKPAAGSFVETVEQLGREYYMGVATVQTAERGLATCEANMFDIVKGLKYPDFMFVRGKFVNGCRDKGAETDDAASKIWERIINRVIAQFEFVRPKSESKDAERIAAKRAEEIAKFEKKSDGVLLEEKAALVAKGDSKSYKAAMAIAKELERREKPVTEAIVKDCAALRDKLVARAKEVAKLGTSDSVELLTAALNALSE
jgi:hypothetical protein